MIEIKVVLFASFKELLECSELTVILDDNSTIDDLCNQLATRGEAWQTLFLNASSKVKIACNQQMAEPSLTLSEKDEVAFFPPVTGG